MGGMDDIIAEFLAESVENLDQLDQDLVTLEKDPSDREVFRPDLPHHSHDQGHVRFSGLRHSRIGHPRRRVVAQPPP